MIGQETRVVERKVVAILKVLSDSPEPLGGRVIARRLYDLGFELGERAVRYHLRLMDERGLTQPVGKRDGRQITSSGIEELKSALVSDRLGHIAARIELLAYATSLDLDNYSGQVPINTSLFAEEEFNRALELMSDAFRSGLCVSDLVAIAHEGAKLGGVTVPQGKVGLATISSIVVSGALLKAGIPLVSRFGGILQVRNQKPLRFTDLIEYSGCSLDPAEIFIASRMTSVRKASIEGDGKILASFGEIPSPCRPETEAIMRKLKAAGFDGLIKLGETNEPICETTSELNKVGLILYDGLNPVAAAAEASIEVTNRAMSGLIEYKNLSRFRDIADKRSSV